MRLIKKYKNRKLYDTLDKQFITLDDIANFVRNGEVIKVVDSLGNDITQEISLKARIKGKVFGGLKREIVEKLIHAFIRFFNGSSDEFVEILLDLVDQGVLTSEMAKDIGNSVIKHFNEFNDKLKADILSVISSAGFVPKEEYEKLKLEYEKLKKRCGKLERK
ncbi:MULTISPECIES: polyhydroxyalkanoate synthesis regulator DNA-binding domain-containing protein [unclassified Thermosipho (in: thermotogales)]|uniref:polyhydroxyalkanoate synthesis regulator DNA-binding domain-containing protein n=1 Tax=unclassified Thermosipho (in: thermotogales) TaxID=2676525 RepID=UPI0009507859|nr:MULTISPECIES: polyhydroxyalkanoate synthesis regulator DNA-binding domain-containing protein [unclassified Thermosipho (in: thermotogales)]APT72384.1 pesticidal protein Cry4BA [Thermosipho sp. 1063]MBT1248078.1 pesticidal protein Cry4BA [Thermosipho sp. 1244]OOC46669.1 pesticidal protein Cry4BA [Thermosipho sp. 1223]